MYLLYFNLRFFFSVIKKFTTISEYFLGLGHYILMGINILAKAGTISFPTTSIYFKNPHHIQGFNSS